MNPRLRWVPPTLLTLGVVFTVGIDRQHSAALRAPLDSVIPRSIEGFTGADIELSQAEARVAGVTEYLMRSYRPSDGREAGDWFTVYIGYYDRQTQGKSIHSPKNCLPGNGWEPLASRIVAVPTAAGPVPVNRYLLRRGERLALVLYWYQGRGRVQANEYLVKWDLLRDAALRQRSEEALVRIVVPLDGAGLEGAAELATRAAAIIVPSLNRALPGWRSL